MAFIRILGKTLGAMWCLRCSGRDSGGYARGGLKALKHLRVCFQDENLGAASGLVLGVWCPLPRVEDGKKVVAWLLQKFLVQTGYLDPFDFYTQL